MYMFSAPLFGALGRRGPRSQLIARGRGPVELGHGRRRAGPHVYRCLADPVPAWASERGPMGRLRRHYLRTCFPVVSRGRSWAVSMWQCRSAARGYVLGGQSHISIRPTKVGGGRSLWSWFQAWSWAWLGFLMREPPTGGADEISTPAQEDHLAQFSHSLGNALVRIRHARHDGHDVRHGRLGLVDPRLLEVPQGPPLWGLGPRTVFRIDHGPGRPGGDCGRRLRPATLWAGAAASYFLVSGMGLLFHGAGGTAVSGRAVSHGHGLHLLWPSSPCSSIPGRRTRSWPMWSIRRAAGRLCREHLRDPYVR